MNINSDEAMKLSKIMGSNEDIMLGATTKFKRIRTFEDRVSDMLYHLEQDCVVIKNPVFPIEYTVKLGWNCECGGMKTQEVNMNKYMRYEFILTCSDCNLSLEKGKMQ